MDPKARAEWVARVREAGVEAIERGWSIIPISIRSKKPLVAWKDFQTAPVTVEQLEDWIENGVPIENGRVSPFNIGLVTGSISGVVVVDADNEAAEAYARKHGLASPFSVKTTRGRHFYFEHPGQGMRFANKVGGSGHDWPDVQGLDFRGDGGFVVMPPSIKWKDGEVVHEYAYELGYGLDWDDLSDFPWRGRPTEVEHAETAFDFNALDLSGVRAASPHDDLAVFDQAKVRVSLLGRKLVDGDGRNNWLTRFAGQKVRQGVTGEALERVVEAFQDEIFADHLPAQEVATILRSVTEIDRRNYPADYDASGERIQKVKEKATLGKLRPVYAGDAQRLLDTLGEQEYWADPIIPKGTITQVVGFNGHGKSYFLGALLSAMAAGRPAFGPYETPQPAKVFYLDYDNPARTLLSRLMHFGKMFGDPGQNIAVWTPTLISPEDGGEMNLRTEAGFKMLGEWLDAVTPEVVVIDTIRNAFPGMDENSPAEWAKVNHVAKTIRNTGASVVLVHHRTKPGEGGLGRETGSTAQLTDIDTQVMVTQVYREKAEAKAKAGLLDTELSVYDADGKDWTPFAYLERRMGGDTRLRMVTQVSFGKVRQQTEAHVTHYIGWCENILTGEQSVVSTMSVRQKALALAARGMTPDEIARKLSVPIFEVRRWLS
jgi:hypothetical protein